MTAELSDGLMGIMIVLLSVMLSAVLMITGVLCIFGGGCDGSNRSSNSGGTEHTMNDNPQATNANPGIPESHPTTATELLRFSIDSLPNGVVSRRTKTKTIIKFGPLRRGETSAVSCAICLEEYRVGDSVVQSNRGACQHAFHRSCMATWLSHENSKDCPCCRVPFFDRSVTGIQPTTGVHDDDDELEMEA